MPGSGFAAWNNPAGYGAKSPTAIHFFQELPYSQPDLSISAVSLQGLIGGFGSSLVLVQYGNAFFSQQALAVSTSKILTGHICLGTGIRLLQTRQYQEEVLNNVLGMVAMTWRVQDQLTLMGCFSNLNLSVYQLRNPEPIPISIRIGTIYQLGPDLQLLLEKSQEGNRGNLSLGFQWKAYQHLFLHAGYAFQRTEGGFGIGLETKKGNWQLGTRISQILPASPFIQYSYPGKN